jgi:hypothetical protein
MKKKLSKLLGIALTLALMTSLLVAATPAAAMTQPQVSVDDTNDGDVIGETTTYTITFTAGKAAAGVPQIIVTFPAGTDLTDTAAANDVTVETLDGIGGGDSDADFVPATAAITPGSPSAPVELVITLGTYDHDNDPGTAEVQQTIGQGSLVGVVINQVVNPNTPGDYTLTVATKAGPPVEMAVTSNTYSIITPPITDLPGIAYAYNSADILMAQNTNIQVCIDAAGPGGRVEVGPGTYDEDILFDDGTIDPDAGGPLVADGSDDARITLVATGDPGTVIIADANEDDDGGTITIENAVGDATKRTGVVIDGFTFKQIPRTGGPATPITIAGTSSYVTITNCTIASGGTYGISDNGAGSTTISNCSIDATSATAAARVGIIAAAKATITGCTISVGSERTTAIRTSGGTGASPFNSSISDTTITGEGGVGIDVDGGYVVIDDVMMSMVHNALDIDGGTVILKNSTIDQCGGPFLNQVSPITVNDGWAAGTAVDVEMYNNTIQNSTEWLHALAIEEAGPGGSQGNSQGVTLTAYNNNFIGNEKQVTNIDRNTIPVDVNNPADSDPLDGGVSMTHNWWGVDTGPAQGSTAGVTTSPYITSNVIRAELALNDDELSAKNTVGIDVNCVDVNGNPQDAVTIAVSKYAENPEGNPPRIAGTGSVLGYYDVYVDAPGVSSVRIKVYGDVNAYTKLMYAGGLAGEWLDVKGSTGVNYAGGYVYLVVNNSVTSPSSPSLTELGGTPFALVEDKTTVAGPSIAGPDGGSPVIGAYDVSVTPMFTWDDVMGSLNYEIELSEDPSFATIVFSNSIDHTFYKVGEALNYDTTYYWRVRGVLDESYEMDGETITPATPWTNGIFTTEAAPVVAPPATEMPATLTEPVIGAYDVSIEPMFTWEPIDGVIRYEIALSEDPTFTIIEWSYNVDDAFYKVDEELRYDSTYYWRVRGVISEPYQEGRAWVTPATPWATGIFTTEMEPVEEAPPDTIVVEPPKPEVSVEIPPTKITVEPAATSQAIPNYMLWIIIAVGIVLVISLIVLIVRTRRVV